MRLAKNQFKVLAVVSATASTTGDAYDLNEIENTSEDELYFLAVHLTQSGGASSPTSKVTVQTSPDKTTWIDVVSSTQLTADGTVDEIKDPTLPLLRYIRAKTVLGGGTAPTHSAVVFLTSNVGMPKLKKVT